MTVKELADQLNKMIEHNEQYGEWNVAVEMSIESFGGTPTVLVRDGRFGFDWDSGLFIITPTLPLMQQQNTQVSKV